MSIERNPDEWNKTRSCWQQSRNSSFASKRRHCGVCAACMLRRLSFHAAGIDQPKENFRRPMAGVNAMSEGNDQLDAEQLGERLRIAREAAGKTQADAALLIGVGRTTLVLLRVAWEKSENLIFTVTVFPEMPLASQ